MRTTNVFRAATYAGLFGMLVGCATAPPAFTATSPDEAEATVERIVSGRKIPDWVPKYTNMEWVLENAAQGRSGSSPGVRFGYHYIWSDFANSSLKTAAGILACTVTVVKDGDGKYSAQGHFSELQQPEVMERTLREADVDNDSFVSLDEALTLSNRLITQGVRCKNKIQ